VVNPASLAVGAVQALGSLTSRERRLLRPEGSGLAMTRGVDGEAYYLRLSQLRPSSLARRAYLPMQFGCIRLSPASLLHRISIQAGIFDRLLNRLLEHIPGAVHKGVFEFAVHGHSCQTGKLVM
jgi:hypothetical protein